MSIGLENSPDKIAKNILSSQYCHSCKWVRNEGEKLDGKFLATETLCVEPNRLHDPHCKWLGKILPRELTCEYWAKC